MKKLTFVLIIALAVAGVAAAQSWTAQTVTVSGTLQLQNGTIAVVNGNTIYYVPALERFIGFIDSLKEGAQASVVGYTAPNTNYMQVVKLTIGGKSYDLVADSPQGMQPPNGYGPGSYGPGGWHGRGCDWGGHRGRW